MIEISSIDIDSILNEISEWKSRSQSNLDKLGAEIASSISSRVQDRGIGSKGLMRYRSKRYKSFRREKGRETSHKTLNFTGKMWQSLDTTRRGDTIILGFSGRDNINKALGNEKIDPFFSITSIEQGVIDNSLKNIVEDLKL